MKRIVRLFAVVCGVVFVCVPGKLPAATFTVTNTDNEGEGSLRQAILDANASEGADTIEFDIEGEGPFIIIPESDLPAITDPVVIDGYTQPGASANTLTDGNDAVLMVELSNFGAENGLALEAGSSTVRGLAINGFFVGILVQSADNVIEGNYVGTDASGNASFFNGFGIVAEDAANNTIGGTGPAARNVVVSSEDTAVWIVGSGATNNFVQGNFIGTDATGLNGPGNCKGIELRFGASSTVIEGNLISGNGCTPVGIVGGSNNLIQANLVGTDPTGTSSVANQNDEGNIILVNTTDNLIGGDSPATRNVISGNFSPGISIFGSGSTGNRIQGNFIGTDITGLSALGNSDSGVLIEDASDTQIDGNVISANGGDGVTILSFEDFATNNVIRKNLIGTDVTGLNPLGNSVDGVFADGFDTKIGSEDLADANVIAFNGFNGVSVNGFGNSVLGNSIFENESLGIDVSDDGVTENDAPDSDGVQNFPVLASAVSFNGLTIDGSLTSAAEATYRLEFFANDFCDDSGFGEGQTFIGTTNVTTDVDGIVEFSVAFTNDVAVGRFITSTATSPDGDTSEFSECAEAKPVVSCSLDPSTSTNLLETTHTVTVTVLSNGVAAAGVDLLFQVSNGPSGNIFADAITDQNGQASFGYENSGDPGKDTIEATGDIAGVPFLCSAEAVWRTNTAPVAACHDIVRSANENCQAIVAGAAVDNGSTDADEDELTFSLEPAGPYPLGTNEVTLTVSDPFESDSCQATIIVVDDTPPSMECPSTQTVSATSPAGAVVNYSTPNATDNCGGATVVCVPASGSTFPIGNTMVQCAATDTAGNTNTCSFTVHVKGPAEQINDAIAIFEDLDVDAKIAKMLTRKLQKIGDKITDDKIDKACKQLEKLIANIAKRRAKGKLTSEQAEALTEAAGQLRVVLGCP